MATFQTAFRLPHGPHTLGRDLCRYFGVMRGRPIRVVRLEGSPRARGRQHGGDCAEGIRDFAADRMHLSAAGTTFSSDDLLDLAVSCLPHHEAYAPDLLAEMEALAEAAGVTAAEALVVGGYTDFIDLVRAAAGRGPVVDECTAVLVPDRMASGGGMLAQTWDMDTTATSHVVMLRIEPDEGPASLVFTTEGCIGQIGINEAGIAVGINNLTAADGRPGVTWPFVVRKALAQTSFEAAVECVLDAPLAGGHNYLMMDRRGDGVSIEAMPTVRHVTTVDGLVGHTNHCLAPDTKAVEGWRPPDLQESSRRRLSEAIELLSNGDVDVEQVVTMLRHESSICRRAAPPHHYETCGAVVMRPSTGEMWACWGIPADNDFEHFTIDPVPA